MLLNSVGFSDTDSHTNLLCSAPHYVCIPGPLGLRATRTYLRLHYNTDKKILFPIKKHHATLFTLMERPPHQVPHPYYLPCGLPRTGAFSDSSSSSLVKRLKQSRRDTFPPANPFWGEREGCISMSGISFLTQSRLQFCSRGPKGSCPHSG